MNGSDIKKTTVSKMTDRNWKRLHSRKNGRLMSRANKQLSDKLFLPLEYFSNKDNITIIQQIKALYLENTLSIPDVIYSVGMALLLKNGIAEKARFVTADKLQLIPEIMNLVLPDDEYDLLGLIYQSLVTEGEKNRKGSYYTPISVAEYMTRDLDFSAGQIFLDPCCGSGAFILSLKGAKPSQIYGCDIDPIAVMMAKFNLLLKYPTEDFEPHIYCCDFLNDNSFVDIRYSYIMSNPPWGAIIYDSKKQPVTTKESFSFFYEKAYGYLAEGGIIRFLLPESVLNVKTHLGFRRFLLENGILNSITLYPGLFSGVQTNYISVETECHETKSLNDCCFSKGIVKVYEMSGTNSEKLEVKLVRDVLKSCFYITKSLNFNILTEDDYHRIRKIIDKGKYTLKDSIWGLGIVTGDNKKQLKKRKKGRLESIYTGKDIKSFILNKPKKYILYKRNDFQQVAKDEIYRAEEKLVYKFISKDLVFAYDNSASLFLNSANVLIPKIPGMSIKTVMAFLNSSLFNYLYKSLFGEIKILKGNLMELPFPEITPETDARLTSLVDEVMSGNKEAIQLIDNEIYKAFGL